MDHTDPQRPRSSGQAHAPFPISEVVLDRYLAGEVSPSEWAVVEQLLREYPAMAAFVEGVRAAQRAEEAESPGEFARGRALLSDRIGFAPQYVSLDSVIPSQVIPEKARGASASAVRRTLSAHGSRATSHVVPSMWTRWPAMVAAGAAALVLGTVALRYRASVSAAPTSVGGREYSTGTGQRATILLDDGTRVRLAPRTTLRVAAAFGHATRTVSLTGEAYFDVAHATGVPFFVNTRDVTTRVLGTVFDVQQYPTDRAVSVTVVDGKVAIARTHGTHAPVTLTAGMTGIVSDSSGPMVALGDASHVVTWIDGQLVFHKAPTPTVLAALTRWYGYEFRLTDSTLANERLTLWLSTESSTAALKTLTQVLNADLTVDHGTVTLSPRRGAHAVPRTGPATQDELAPSTSEVGR